jgi:hypothetical protein
MKKFVPHIFLRSQILLDGKNIQLKNTICRKGETQAVEPGGDMEKLMSEFR